MTDNANEMIQIVSEPAEIVGELSTAVEDAWNDGCPVAGPPFSTVAEAARRRWLSQDRRLGQRASTVERIEDLAKGLRDRFERDRKLVGPLMIDYRHLAGRLVQVLERDSDD